MLAATSPWTRRGVRICCCVITLAAAALQPDRAQPQCIGYDRDRTKAHRAARNHRIEHQPPPGIEHTGRDRDAYRVVDKSEEEILADVAHRRTTETQRTHDPAQVAAHQRHARTFHRDVRPGAHRDSDVGGGERRRVVDPITGHRDHASRLLEFDYYLGLTLRQDL